MTKKNFHLQLASRVFSDGSPSRKVNKETINITWNSGNKSGGQTDVLRRQHGEEARDGSYHLRVPPIGAEMEVKMNQDFQSILESLIFQVLSGAYVGYLDFSLLSEIIYTFTLEFGRCGLDKV